jgi:hypothetical protein
MSDVRHSEKVLYANPGKREINRAETLISYAFATALREPMSLIVAENKLRVSALSCLFIRYSSFSFIGYSEFAQPITERISGEPQQTCGLTLVAAGAPQGFADHVVFPLF